MQTRAGVLIAAGALIAGAATAAPTTAAASATPTATAASPAALDWEKCGTKRYPRLECAALSVPLDHADPGGDRISLALSRIPHTARTSQGPLLVNPGGPGASGRTLAGFVAAALPSGLAAQYDVIGFDPRGVGASRPALNCLPGHFSPVRPDSVPRDAEEERRGAARAAAFARACGEKHGKLLPHMDTVSSARDMDAIRVALGAERINYLGYSYGTYLGAVYAKLYPQRVRRAVLDSVVHPGGVWYDANLAQDLAFDARHKAFLAWVARHDATYRLGTDPAGVEARWYAMREALREEPAGGKVGGAELEDTYLPGGYHDGYWPLLADAFSSYVRQKDSGPLVKVYEAVAELDAQGDNGYSVYTAVECRDARWPRAWGTWHRDNWATHAKAPFSTWNNAWYNAPCAFWPVAPREAVDVANEALPPVLLVQASEDAATPYEGAVAMRRLLAGSRLVVERGGGNHGVTLRGNACVDRHLVRYLESGEVPSADAECAARPAPEPASARSGA
ncbi:alpha/beta fold hydrolase [Streptomyces sp. MUM 203J]|uniref:alpha/beta hydrolase n=1 Tax=Streptomyces sp. MUM 203J TaxID=2791990 RepID=UPI001F03FE3D|nr:alpha/beta hydrolase [Streptomyces sp. MUM 203J]MCH0542447.1 alpha/beta fold hydrolase [Streptomyces sp. MUM 203J]